MMMKQEVKNNLKKSINKIKSLISVNEYNLIDDLQIDIADLDYSETKGELNMVMLGLSFKTYSEPVFDEFIKISNEINSKINSLMNMISFDDKGYLKTVKTGGVLTYTGEPMVSKIEFSHRDDNISFELDYMFYV
jgi:hypothetical protein